MDFISRFAIAKLWFRKTSAISTFGFIFTIRLVDFPKCDFFIIIIIIIINNHAYAGVNDCFTHLRALLVLHNTAAFWPTQLALLGIIPPTESKSLKDGTLARVLWLCLALNTLLDLLATKAPPLKHRVPASILTGHTSELTYVLSGRTNS